MYTMMIPLRSWIRGESHVSTIEVEDSATAKKLVGGPDGTELFTKLENNEIWFQLSHNIVHW